MMTSMTGGRSDLLAISDLLRSGHEAEEEGYEASNCREKVLTPADIGPPKSTEKLPEPADPNAIWEESEAVVEQDAFYDPDDRRPQPEYDIVYKQNVMTEDNFLGMAGKTPGSQDCTHIVVKVSFPGCRLRDLDLEVNKNSILAASPKLRLATYLPHQVDESQGVANWDSATDILSVTLPIIPEEW